MKFDRLEAALTRARRLGDRLLEALVAEEFEEAAQLVERREAAYRELGELAPEGGEVPTHLREQLARLGAQDRQLLGLLDKQKAEVLSALGSLQQHRRDPYGDPVPPAEILDRRI